MVILCELFDCLIKHTETADPHPEASKSRKSDTPENHPKDQTPNRSARLVQADFQCRQTGGEAMDLCSEFLEKDSLVYFFPVLWFRYFEELCHLLLQPDALF